MAPTFSDPHTLVVGVLIAIAVTVAVSALVLLPAFYRFARRHLSICRSFWPGLGVAAGPVYVLGGATLAACTLAAGDALGAAVGLCLAVAGAVLATWAVRVVKAEARAGRSAPERVAVHH